MDAGALPAGVPSFRVAIIGAGAAGRSFAALCLSAGCHVTLEDVLPEKLRRLADNIDDATVRERLRLVTTVEDAVRDADLALDFVPDELESKLEIFSMLDRMAPPRTILLTPTEALSIADLASCTYRPSLCFGLRGLQNHPPAQSQLTLIHPEPASPEAQEFVMRFLAQLGFRVTTLQDDMPSDLVARA